MATIVPWHMPLKSQPIASVAGEQKRNSYTWTWTKLSAYYCILIGAGGGMIQHSYSIPQAGSYGTHSPMWILHVPTFKIQWMVYLILYKVKNGIYFFVIDILRSHGRCAISIGTNRHRTISRSD